MAKKPFTTINAPAGSLTFLGSDVLEGTYVLQMKVNKPLRMAFGDFNRRKQYDLEPGFHSYVGSARKAPQTRAFPLARRLVRHASRCGRTPPFAIRELMQSEFVRVGLGEGDLRPKNGKRLRWNVDHLLERPSVELVGAFVVRCHQPIEGALGRLLLNDPVTVAFAPGLGAADFPGSTHLLRVEADEQWWLDLRRKIYREFREVL